MLLFNIMLCSYVLKGPKGRLVIPTGSPSQNKVNTYLLTYLLSYLQITKTCTIVQHANRYYAISDSMHMRNGNSTLRASMIPKCGDTVKPVLSDRRKIDKTQILMTNGSLMKVESIAECSDWSILQYF